SVPESSHLQTSMWARLKARNGWAVQRLIVRRGDRLIGGFQMLHRRIPILGRVGYVPRGPVFAEENAVLHKLVCERLLSLAKPERLSYLAVRPPRTAAEFVPALQAVGFRPSALQLAPTST